MTHARLPILLLSLAVLASAPAAAAERAEESLEFSAALPSGKGLAVENLLGSIEIQAVQNSREVRVTAQVVVESEDFEAARELARSIVLRSDDSSGTLRVLVGLPVDQHTAFRMPKSEVDGVFSKWVSPIVDKSTVSADYDGRLVEVGQAKGAARIAVHLKVAMPFDIESSFRQVVGSIHGSGLRGNMSIEIVDGTMAAEQFYGKLRARTGGGGVTIHSFHGDSLEVQTSSGRIDLRQIEADETTLRTSSGKIQGGELYGRTLKITTATGGVELTDVETLSFDVNTGSGQVDLGTRLKATREASVESISGNVTLRVGKLSYFELVADTKSGSVKTKGLPIEIERRDEGGSRLLHGSGGASLVVRSGGDLTVRPL